MTDNKKPVKIIFAPGSFDNFEGTQEELDDLVAEINRLVDTGEIFDEAHKIDPSSMTPEEIYELEKFLESIVENQSDMPRGRLLN